MTTVDARIAKTGFVIQYPAIEALAEPERWFVCDARGIVHTKGSAGLNAGACHAMLTRGGLIVYHALAMSGATIYRMAAQ